MKKRAFVIVTLAIVLGLFLAVPHGYAQTGPGTADQGYGYGMGPGMMGPGYGYGYGMGPGMMGPGYGYGNGRGPGMMGPGYGYGYGMGPGMMGPGYGYGYGMGPGMMGPGYGYGYGRGPQYEQPYGGQYQRPQRPIDEKEAKALLENYLASARNPNLKLGKVEDKGNAFVGDIVTAKGGELVDRIAIDKDTGWMHPAR